MRALLAALALLACLPATAQEIAPRAGWAVHATPHGAEALIDRVKAAVKAEGLFVVTQAGPTGAAKRRGIEIPRNRVIGVFNNDYAVRVIRLSGAAMIEAPIRLYVTEGPDGSAQLSYKLPSTVFAPYADEGGAPLAEIAVELDGKFAAIAARAIAE